MNPTQAGIIALMKSAITGKGLPLPAEFSLDEAMELITSHHMTALIYQGAVTCGLPPREGTMGLLFQHYLRAMMRSEGQQREIARIQEAFSREGIDYMLLKGSRMKNLYPAPELRYMGDADILIRLDQYERIVPVMESLGFTFSKESEHELVWKSKSLYLELHKCLIPDYNLDLYAYYGDGWQLAVPYQGSEYRMKPEDEWIFLFTHFAKHFRDGGIGCRYVGDLWVWRRHHPDMDEDYIRRVLSQMYLEEFYGNILDLIDYWFCDGQGSGTLDVITQFIFSSGSWGEAEQKLLSISVRDARYSGSHLNGRLRYILKNAFPGLAIKSKYKILEKAPWMLPLVWIYRPFLKIFCERKDLKNHARNVRALNEGKVRQREDLLKLAGLDYHKS